jgi:putative ABC transport system ATP-binding protein
LTLVSARRLTRRYARPGSALVVAVDSVDLDVDAGRIVAIEGPSGSGKSTLLGLLAGLESPDDGSISVFGHDLSRLSRTELARLRQRRVGIVFQSFGLIASLRASENVGLPLALADVPGGERDARSRAALDDVGLASVFDARIDELSGGERQRVAVARALVIRPALILADEPTGSLDEANGAGVLQLLIDAVRRRGASLVLVTHDPATASLADQRFGLVDGRLTAEVGA